MIGYNRVGGTRKGLFKSIKMPLQVQDALVIIMVLLAVGVTIGYWLMNRGH
jgi:hypothetical protein